MPTARHHFELGHETSVSLEPMFWKALERAAAATGQPLNALIARIDAERIQAAAPPNLASALRQWLFRQALGSGDDGTGESLFGVRGRVEP